MAKYGLPKTLGDFLMTSRCIGKDLAMRQSRYGFQVSLCRVFLALADCCYIGIPEGSEQAKNKGVSVYRTLLDSAQESYHRRNYPSPRYPKILVLVSYTDDMGCDMYS